MRSLFWTTFLLSILSASGVLADECEARAAEIAGKMGLDAGAHAKDNSIALSARTDEEDDGGGHDPKRLESQDDQGKYGSGEEADQSHELIGAPQCQSEIAEQVWEDMCPEQDSSQ